MGPAGMTIRSMKNGSGLRTRISVVTPTLFRPEEVMGLLENLCRQILLPEEVIIVDGAPQEEKSTEARVVRAHARLPFRCHYIRAGGGTAVQRNIGIDAASGNFLAFIDDDVRLDRDFFERIVEVFADDDGCRIGGIAGYITNQYFDPQRSLRWKWYRRLRLLSTYEPGRYDFNTGYPVNRYMYPPHSGVRKIDFMGANCAVWRKAVFSQGFRFDEFFADYGVLEDVHFALRAGRKWDLYECGRARCVHLRSPGGRVNSGQMNYKTAVNYRYVFVDAVPRRTWRQECAFWRMQIFDLCRLAYVALRSGNPADWHAVGGKCAGIRDAVGVRPPPRGPGEWRR
ncbi:MAG: glycosyltransferase [Candidatus Omnitrophica bacterium]|nr:glycosyltransferase [Candidatus Omnitrophota bacterium]